GHRDAAHHGDPRRRGNAVGTGHRSGHLHGASRNAAPDSRAALAPLRRDPAWHRALQAVAALPMTSLLRVQGLAKHYRGYTALAEALQLGRTRRHERAMRERALQVLEEIRLTAQAASPAAALSYGQKKLLELGMALMTEPRLLLLDEPVAGVNPALIDEL